MVPPIANIQILVFNARLLGRNFETLLTKNPLSYRYIGTAFVFFVISPVYLLAFKKSASLGMLLSFATILASSGLNIAAMIRKNFPPIFIAFDSPPAQYADKLAEVCLQNFFENVLLWAPSLDPNTVLLIQSFSRNFCKEA